MKSKKFNLEKFEIAKLENTLYIKGGGDPKPLPDDSDDNETDATNTGNGHAISGKVCRTKTIVSR